MAEYENLLYNREPPVARIQFNRPEVRNATNLQTWKEMLVCLDEVEEDPELRVIVLGGVGSTFCAGQDLKASAAMTARQFEIYQRYLNRAWERIEQFPKPIIARVHGHAIAGGTYLVSRCDLSVAKRGVRFGLREIHVGYQTGGSFILTVGKARSMEINLLGRYFSAEEAERWGIINKVVDTDEELDAQVNEWVEQLVALPPLALAATKEATNFAMDLAGYRQLRAAKFGRHLLATEDRFEARRSFLEKRKPVFKGR